MSTHKDTHPKKKSSALWRITVACVITLLAFLLSTVMMSPLSASISAFFSVPERNDFTITDFYTIVADARAISHLDGNVVIVNIDNSDRNEIADILSIVDDAGAKAVCLDVMFDDPRDGDQPLLNAVTATRNLVMPVVMVKTSESPDSFSVGNTSFFYHTAIDSAVVYAAANMPSKYDKSVIREFQPSFPTHTGVDVPSLAVAAAELASPRAVKKLRERDNDLETINFHSRRFIVLQPDELIDNAAYLKDRIVLIGAITEPSDMHPTPVESHMPGVMIHAHSIATILDGAYMNPIPKAVSIAIAFVLCVIFVSINLFMTHRTRGLLLRLLQVLLVWLAVQIGYWAFVSHNIIIDFSYALLMLAFGLFACDIWNGLVAIGQWLVEKVSKLFKKPAPASGTEKTSEATVDNDHTNT